MSTLLLVSLYEFKLFLQIVSWIAIPGIILALVITTIFHYRRKKNRAPEPEPGLMAAGGPGTRTSEITGLHISIWQLRKENAQLKEKLGDRQIMQDLQQKLEAIREKTDQIQKLESGLEALKQQQATLQSLINAGNPKPVHATNAYMGRHTAVN